jgi:hypothetical protein
MRALHSLIGLAFTLAVFAFVAPSNADAQTAQCPNIVYIQGYVTTHLGQEAVRFIDQQKANRPFTSSD